MSVTTTKSLPPAQQLRQTLHAMSHEFSTALPAHITAEKFMRVVMTVVQLQPELLNADRQSLLAACLTCAKDGLIPDGREAALVLFRARVQYIPMFFGIQKRIRNSGEISYIQAHVIYEHDKFVFRRGLVESIEHEPLFPGDRGRPIGAYAVAKFRDSDIDPVFEVMTYGEIEKVRSVSRASNAGPWQEWWEEMARKTVFRRLSKWLPMDADMDILLRRDDQDEAAPSDSTAGAGTPSLTIVHDAFEAASSGSSGETRMNESSQVIESNHTGT